MRIDDLKTFPGHLVRRAQQTISAIFTEAMVETELTSVQYIALVAVSDVPDLDATRLAQLIFFDRATIGGVIERLERKGLIERRQSASDKRIKVLATTPAGEAMIVQSFQRVEEAQERFLAPLNAREKVQFMRLLDRLVDR